MLAVQPNLMYLWTNELMSLCSIKKLIRLVLALSDEMLFFLGDFLGFPDKELKITYTFCSKTTESFV